MWTRRTWLWAAAAAFAAPPARYLRWREVGPELRRFEQAPIESEWEPWLAELDGAIRARIDRGAEDSVTRLLLYGASFTRLPRLRSPEAAFYSNGTLTPAAQARLNTLAAALAGPSKEERLEWGRRALGAGPYAPVLLRNLERMSREPGNGDPTRRGIGVETSLGTHAAVEAALLAAAQLLPRVRRAAVIGPGLDFVDRRDGVDFYPLQTLQPFALMEALERLGFPGVPVTAYDLNPGVLAHIERLTADLAAGRPRSLQLVYDPHAGGSEGAAAYWRNFGTALGREASGSWGQLAPAGMEMRTIVLKPELGARLAAAELNVVTQTVETAAYDLIAVTNLLGFYERTQQAMALLSLRHMLAPRGVILANTPPPLDTLAGLEIVRREPMTFYRRR